MKRRSPHSLENDSGTAKPRPVRRAPAGGMPIAIRRVLKTYGSRLPVSGKYDQGRRP